MYTNKQIYNIHIINTYVTCTYHMYTSESFYSCVYVYVYVYVCACVCAYLCMCSCVCACCCVCFYLCVRVRVRVRVRVYTQESVEKDPDGSDAWWLRVEVCV